MAVIFPRSAIPLSSNCPRVARRGKNAERTKISRAHLYRNEDRSGGGGRGVRVTGHAVKVLPKEEEGGSRVFPLFVADVNDAAMRVQQKRRVKNRRDSRKLEKQIRCVQGVSFDNGILCCFSRFIGFFTCHFGIRINYLKMAYYSLNLLF